MANQTHAALTLIILVAFVAGASTAAEARVEAKCLASYLGERGWSRERRVDVEFYAMREIDPDARRFPIVAKIWFNPEDPALVALDGTSLVTPQFLVSSLAKLYADRQPRVGSELDDPQRWRVRCVMTDGTWTDPRYPEAFDPPMPVPPKRRYY